MNKNLKTLARICDISTHSNYLNTYLTNKYPGIKLESILTPEPLIKFNSSMTMYFTLPRVIEFWIQIRPDAKKPLGVHELDEHRDEYAPILIKKSSNLTEFCDIVDAVIQRAITISKI